MKIEKLTENKIRVIVNLDDLNQKNLDLHSIMSKSVETQGLILEMLSRAEKELGFRTEGCKLLIEAFSSGEDAFVFTITKYYPNDTNDGSPKGVYPKPKISIKNKVPKLNSSHLIYGFPSFDEFCHFCSYINSSKQINSKKVAKNISLYFYGDIYYLALSDIDVSYQYLNKFYSILSEFGTLTNYSDNFESKLLEYGKVIFPKNAIIKAIKFFVKQD